MLASFLPPEHVLLVEALDDWQAAIRLSAQPLLAGGFISPLYVERIFSAYADNGPYFVIAPGIAMPHARPEDGVARQGLSLLVVREGVDFGCENDPVYLVAMLCATDIHSHVQMLSALTNLLGDDDAVAALREARDVAAISSVIQDF